MSKRIIIRAPNHLGDCVMALPMINETREAYPGAHVTLLVSAPLAELFTKNPAIDDIMKIAPEHVHGLMAVMKIKDLLAGKEFDCGYILPPSFGAAAGLKLGGVTERIGYIADGRRLLLTKPLPLPEPLNSSHRSELYFNLLRRGAGVDLEFVRPKLFVDDDDVAAGLKLLAGFDVTDLDQYAVFAFRAVAESRRWGIDNYAKLAEQIVSKFGYKVILIGLEPDRADGDRIVEQIGREVINLAGRTNLRETAAILSRARFFVGNDSGPAHLAAAVGIPLVVLSGADDPNATSPISNQKHLIYKSDLDCIGCVKNKCPLKGDAMMACMTQISVESVVEAVESLLQG